MKTIKIYLLLILFFNIFSQSDNISDSPTIDLTNTNPDISDPTTKNSYNTDQEGGMPPSDTSSNLPKESPDNVPPTTELEENSYLTQTENLDNTGNSEAIPNIPEEEPTNQINSDDPTTKPVISDKPSTNQDITTDAKTEAPSGNSTEPQPTIVLIGFGRFNRPRTNLAIFRVFFKRYISKLAAKLLYFTVNINYLRRLRILEEQKANCTLVTEENNDDMAYDCNVPISENKDFIMSANDDFEFVGLDPNFKFSSYANKTRKAINNQTSEYVDIFTLYNATLTTYDNTFIIKGVLDDELNDKQVILSFDEDGKGDLTNATCKVNKAGGSNYKLDCTSSKRLKAHLDGVMGKTSTKPLLILKKEGEDDLVDVDSTPYKYGAIGKKSSGGLSSGGVAGIIIACCVALIAALIAGYFCSKQTRPPMEPTALPMDSSNSIQNVAY